MSDLPDEDEFTVDHQWLHDEMQRRRDAGETDPLWRALMDAEPNECGCRCVECWFAYHKHSPDAEHCHEYPCHA